MKRRIIYVILMTSILVLALILLKSGTGKNKEVIAANPKVCVSILPIKSLIDNISGGLIEVEVIVPPGSSPETYEPTPQQILSINESAAFFATGLLDFENALIKKLQLPENKFFNLSTGVHVIEGVCSHIHHNGHVHGVDPHIWLSLRCLKKMTETTFMALSSLFPDSGSFESNYLDFINNINEADRNIAEKLSAAQLKTFLIYHPALTYYARDYDLTQLVMEQDGKEPSADQLITLIRQARQRAANKILYQKEFSITSVQTIARDLGASIIEIDPLAEDVVRNIVEITDVITAK